MIPIEVRLSLPIVAPLLDVMKDLMGGLKRNLATSPNLAELDSEFRDVWTGDLLESQKQDLHTLLTLFDEKFFAEGIVSFHADNAEAILRACSAVRLRLRTRHLESLGDEVLESGEIDVPNLPEPMRKAFLCYLFLATIQELIIQHIDGTFTG
jgi:hypothetical protein